MKSICLGTILAICAAADAFSAAPSSTIFESAILGPMAQPVDQTIVIVPDQYLCARFHVSQPTLVDQVGGLMRRYPSSHTVSIFAAIAPITSSSGFPQLSPSQFQPLAVTSLDLTTGDYADWRAPLSVLLSPGDYALIFGTGRFGVSGNAVMYRESPDTLQASYFQGSYHLPDGRNDIWLNSDYLQKLRFVVTGTVVPEPSTIVLAFVAFTAFPIRRR